MLRRRYFSRAAPVAALVTVFSLNLVAFSQGTVATSSAPKDHVLFVGTDLTVKQDGKFYHVVGATKTTLKIEKDRALADVRLATGANIKINKGVKLSNLSATIANIQTESSDPASARAQLAAMQSSMALMDELSDERDRLQGAIVRAQTFGDARMDNPLFPEDSGSSKDLASKLQEKFANALPMLDTLRSSTNDLLIQNIASQAAIDDELTLDASNLPGLNLIGGASVGDSGSAGAVKSFTQGNAPTGTAEVELTFDVSSPEPLDRAYILVVAHYASLTNPDQVARQISARDFEHLDSHPTRVKMKHPASINRLPFRKFDLALFANGQEVATNRSENRMALTTDQAFQYFLIDYLSAHKGATLRPTPILMIPRAQFRRQLEGTAADQSIYANVDKMGNVLAISTDAEGTQPLSPAMESTLHHVRFMPALEKGTPVEGQLKLRIGDLVR